MFGIDDGKDGFGVRNFFGPGGSVSTVTELGNDLFQVTGSAGHDGTYIRNGNVIMGSDGVHTVVGGGPVKTVIGPDGVKTVFDNGFGGTVL